VGEEGGRERGREEGGWGEVCEGQRGGDSIGEWAIPPGIEKRTGTTRDSEFMLPNLDPALPFLPPSLPPSLTSFSLRIEYVYTEPAKARHARATNRLFRFVAGVISKPWCAAAA